jgi:flagella synthesis protein FlgN
LQNLLAEEAAQLRDFLALLEAEQQALAGGDVDRLLALAADKNTHFFPPQRGWAKRAAWPWTAAGCGADRQGMEQLAAPEPRTGRRPQRLGELLALAEKARAMNQTNGKLIATRLANNQQALSALMAAANQASLYGPGRPGPAASAAAAASVPSDPYTP